MTNIRTDMIISGTVRIPTWTTDKVYVQPGCYVPGLSRWTDDLKFTTTQYFDGHDLAGRVQFIYLGYVWSGMIVRVSDVSKLYDPSRKVEVSIRMEGPPTKALNITEIPVIERYTMGRKTIDVTTNGDYFSQFLPSPTLEITFQVTKEQATAYDLKLGTEIEVTLFNHGLYRGKVDRVRKVGDAYFVTLHSHHPGKAYETDPASPSGVAMQASTPMKETPMRNTKMNPGMKRFYVGSNQTTADWTHDTLAEAEKHAQDMIDTGDYEETFVVEIRSVARRQKPPVKVTKFTPAKKGKK